MKVLLVIPAYNEQDNILNTYNKISEYNCNSDNPIDLIVINDGSKDNTEEILRENNIPHIQLVHNLGIGGAVQTGYKYAFEHGYDVAVQFDGDGQHDVNCVPDIVTPVINDEADFVIGSRFVKIPTAELLRKGYRMKEVPVLMHEREGGVSSISSFKSIYYMINVLITILIIRLRRYTR